jgi:hypothetical protein
MGPLVLDAWCFDRFFADFGKKTTDYYELIKLSPARVYFGWREFIAIADNFTWNRSYFENIEKGSGAVLHDFMMEAQSNYNIAIKDLVYRPVFHHRINCRNCQKGEFLVILVEMFVRNFKTSN